MRTKIFIDAGHGGKDSGAYNYHVKMKESDVALKVAKALRKKFKSEKRKFKFSRKTDKFVDLNKRWQMANKWGADLSLCIHCNSTTGEYVRGTEVYYEGANDKKLAEIISKELADGLNIQNRGAKDYPWAMTKYPKMPAVLIEIDFISNDTFARKCKDKKYINKIAELIYKGVRKWEKG